MVTNGQDISRRCLFAFLIKYFTFVKFTSADPNLRIAAAANDGVAGRSDPKSCDVFRPSDGPKSWSVSSVAPKPFSSNKSCHLVMLQAPERHLLLTKWDLSAFWVMTVLMMNKKISEKHDHLSEMMLPQCGNYGNLHLHSFDRNFVKATFLIRKVPSI